MGDLFRSDFANFAPSPRIQRTLATRFVVAVAVAASGCLGIAHDAAAAGMTGHVTAGKIVIEKLENSALRDLLRNNETNFLHGTLFPDAVLLSLQTAKSDKADAISHGVAQNNCMAPIGVPARFWSKFWQDCPQGPTGSDKCAQNFSFFMGMLTHLVTDGPWHNLFIDVATQGQCDAGGPSDVGRDPDGSVNGSSSNGRHAVADTDFDLCLARAVNGKKDDIQATGASLAEKFKTAERQGSYGCPKDQFPDAGFSGCYSCPAGYGHNPVFAVDTPGVCVKKPLSLKKASRTQNYGCPSGQFSNKELSACYSCPDGYTHNGALTVDTPGVCYQKGGYTLRCSVVQAPTVGVPTKLGTLASGQNLLTTLSTAIAAEGGRLNELALAAAISGFSAGFALLKEDAAKLATTPAGPVCSWIIKNGMAGNGALIDSASEAARFLDALWNQMGWKSQVSVIRIGTYEYAVVKDGQVLHRNWHRKGCSNSRNAACSTSNDQCVDDDCRQTTLDCNANGAPPTRANVYISDGVSSQNRMLSTNNEGSKVDLYYKDDGSNRQRWRFQPAANGTYNIVLEGGTSGNRRYLSTASDGSRVDLYTQDDGSGRQRWKIQLNTGIKNGSSTEPYYTIQIADGVSDANRLYLGSSNDGSVVGLYQSDDTKGRQRWTFRSLDPPPVAKANPLSTQQQSAPATASTSPQPLITDNGMCLDIHGPDYDSKQNGGKIQLWACNGGANQRWRWDGKRLVAGNGKCLDIHGSDFDSKQNGGKLQLWDCHSGTNQNWRWDGKRLVAENGKCLDVDGGGYNNKQNGGKIQLWDCHGGANQNWRNP